MNNSMNNSINNKINNINTNVNINLLLNKLLLIIKKIINNLTSILNPFQIIVIIAVIIVLLTLLVKFIIDKIISHYTIEPDLKILELNNNVPFLTYYIDNNNYKRFYKEFLYKYYTSNIDSRNNSFKNIVDSVKIKEQYNNVCTYSFWIYLTSNKSSLTEYFKKHPDLNDIINNNNSMSILNNLLYTVNDNNVLLFSRRFNNDEKTEYPGVYINKSKLILKLFNSINDTNIILEYNNWVNIVISINNNIISVYKNGKLEYTINYINTKNILINKYDLYLLTTKQNNYMSLKSTNKYGSFNNPCIISDTDCDDECNEMCFNDNKLISKKYYIDNNNNKYYVEKPNKTKNDINNSNNCDNNDIIKTNYELITENDDIHTTEALIGFEGYFNNFYFYNKIFTPEKIKEMYINNLIKFDNLQIKIDEFIIKNNVKKKKDNKKIKSKKFIMTENNFKLLSNLEKVDNTLDNIKKNVKTVIHI